MNVYESIKNNLKEDETKDLKEAVDSCSLSRIKELAGYLQDFIDGCEARGMTELRLPYSHLAGDALAVAGNNGGWITLTEDFSYDYDEVFDEYRVDEPIHEDDEEDYDESESNNENTEEIYNEHRKKITTKDSLTEADNDLTALSEGIAKYIISIMQKDIDLTNKGVKINTTIQDNKIEVATYQDGKPINVQLINIDEIKRSIK